MIYDVKHLFNGLFAICIFFLRQSIHNFCPFFRLFIVGLYKLFIFDSCSLSQVSFSNIFPVCSLSSHFLEVVFSKVETFQFNEVQVNQFCLSWTLPFVLCLKSPCHSQSRLHFLYAIFWGCILHFCLWPFLTECLWRYEGLCLPLFSHVDVQFWNCSLKRLLFVKDEQTVFM